jgi:hypothetical protein
MIDTNKLSEKQAQALLNYLAKHHDLQAPVGSLTFGDLLKWCELLAAVQYGN